MANSLADLNVRPPGGMSVDSNHVSESLCGGSFGEEEKKGLSSAGTREAGVNPTLEAVVGKSEAFVNVGTSCSLTVGCALVSFPVKHDYFIINVCFLTAHHQWNYFA